MCSSFTKTLAPGFRIGWCAPGRYLEPVRRLKMANTMGTPLVLQKTITDFLRLGGFDHHLRGLRRTYRLNLRLYTEALRRSCPPGIRALSGNSMPSNPGGALFDARRRENRVASTFTNA